MKGNEIGRISFEFDEGQLEEIANSGNLGVFVEKATKLFRQNLKAELVNSVASGTTTLVRYDNDEFGSGGPIGPFPHIFAEMESITSKLVELEFLVKHIE